MDWSGSRTHCVSSSDELAYDNDAKYNPPPLLGLQKTVDMKPLPVDIVAKSTFMKFILATVTFQCLSTRRCATGAAEASCC